MMGVLNDEALDRKFVKENERGHRPACAKQPRARATPGGRMTGKADPGTFPCTRRAAGKHMIKEQPKKKATQSRIIHFTHLRSLFFPLIPSSNHSETW